MRAILIDPELRTVTNITLVANKEGPAALDEMCKIIGCDGMDHCLIDDMRDTIWVDEHGLKRGQPIYAFKLRIIRDPFAGKAIIIGADELGRSRAPFFPIDLLKREIVWLGRIVPDVHWVEEANRLSTVVTYSREK